MIPAGRAEAAFWAAFLRNRNVDAGTASDGAVAVAGGFALCVLDTALEYTVGAGTTRPLRPDDIDVVEAFYGKRRLPARFEFDDAVLRRDEPMLRERGYLDDGPVSAVLEAPVSAGDATTDVEVRPTSDRRNWAELIARATWADEPVPPLALRTTHIEAAAAQVLVIASIAGEEAGGAALGIVGDTAFLYAAGVVPAFRGKGVYGELIAARLRLAVERGAERAMLKTEPDAAAERVALRHGFTRTALRRCVRR